MQKNTEPIPTAIRRSGLLSCFWLRENCRGQVKLWSPGRSMWVQGHMTDISTDLWSHSQSLKAAGFPAVWAAPSDAHQWRGCVCVPPTLGISCCQGDINKAGRGLSSALKLLPFPVDCWLFAASSLCTSWDEVTWREVLTHTFPAFQRGFSPLRRLKPKKRMCVSSPSRSRAVIGSHWSLTVQRRQSLSR